jgi:UDP-3-O-[3-hydroxymyristoyl] glucosamine N-acyltransferase
MIDTETLGDIFEDAHLGVGYMTSAYAFVHPTAEIGPGTVLMPFAYIGPRVTIGANCFIGPGACIGQPGFGYEKDDSRDEQLYRRHKMGVIIGDDVHIGANTCIDQGRHRPTRIGRGTKIDNLVHIAHNVEIGEDCLIIALSMLAGSVKIGDRVQVSPCAAVRDWRSVGDDALVGLGAVVVKDVEAGATVKGVPAR